MDSRKLPPGICELSLLFTNDSEIRKLNRTWRKKDKATDVLSFSHVEGLKPRTWERSLGEIVVSLDTAKMQARKFGVTIHEELKRLMIHGTLHLFGYDHEKVSKSTAQKMRRTEARLLKGCGAPKLTESRRR